MLKNLYNHVILKHSDGETKVVGQKAREDLFLYKSSNLCTDASDRLWVGVACGMLCDSWGKTLLVFEDDEWKINNPEIENGKETNQEIGFMFLDKKNRLWVVTNWIEKSSLVGNSFYVWGNNSWSQYKDVDSNDTIWDFAFDKNNDLWFSTQKKGVFKVTF